MGEIDIYCCSILAAVFLSKDSASEEVLNQGIDGNLGRCACGVDVNGHGLKSFGMGSSRRRAGQDVVGLFMPIEVCVCWILVSIVTGWKIGW